MNSLDPDFDWHQKGVFIAMFDGLIIPETTATTPWSCRAALLALGNRPWSKLAEEGYVVQGFAPIVPPVIKMQEQVTSNETHWRYVLREPAPSGEVLLLTIGRVTVTGTYKGDGSYIAWAPKIQRDKALEKELGLL